MGNKGVLSSAFNMSLGFIPVMRIYNTGHINLYRYRYRAYLFV